MGADPKQPCSQRGVWVDTRPARTPGGRGRDCGTEGTQGGGALGAAWSLRERLRGQETGLRVTVTPCLGVLEGSRVTSGNRRRGLRPGVCAVLFCSPRKAQVLAAPHPGDSSHTDSS